MVVETAVVALVVAVVAALVVAAVVVVMVPRAVVAVSAGMILCSHFQKVRFSCIFKRRNGRPDVPTDRQRCEDSSKKWLTCLGFFFFAPKFIPWVNFVIASTRTMVKFLNLCNS